MNLRLRTLNSACFVLLLVLGTLSCTSCQRTATPVYDILIAGGEVYDGSGGAAVRADVAISGDKIARIGQLDRSQARRLVDASGQAVAPGFINMLSWSTESLIADGNSQGEIRQGVTTQIMGEGNSMGPLTPAMKERMLKEQGDIKFPIEWTTLSEYLEYLERKGVSQNVASFVGATTLREYAIGLEDKPPTPGQLDLMRKLAQQEMAAGALGIASSLIYAPANYAETSELIELCKAVAPFRGKYISHMRSEGSKLLEGVEELIRISREAGIPAEIYHLKASGEAHWGKMDAVIQRVEAARREGLKITADMYTYTASSTGLNACIPLWAQSGGPEAMRQRFRDPKQRRKILREMTSPAQGTENRVNPPEKILLVEFKSEPLKPLQGKTLAEVAELRAKSPAETVLDLMTEDESRVGVVYFTMSENNLRKQIALPWVSFGSDGASMAPEGIFLKSSTHPRAYGNFARLLGKYVREEKLLSLAEAIRKLTSFPAQNLGLAGRGFLKEGFFADVVVFDPQTIQDKATFEKPHQYAVGVKDVLVNGQVVLNNRRHTGARPGRALWGLGKRK
ncbi:MAG: D-aminoacylase [Acidobacteria bacterium]|nr:D-aminoacylase [Acidobacteriota bacterium]